ncbi:hypothetical protein DFH06DRAFT_1227609 [Mycena polygramma]|nr:hypothetical protein DFH06DRAFT_1227609 [Mycena polygramma]
MDAKLQGHSKASGEKHSFKAIDVFHHNRQARIQAQTCRGPAQSGFLGHPVRSLVHLVPPLQLREDGTFLCPLLGIDFLCSIYFLYVPCSCGCRPPPVSSFPSFGALQRLSRCTQQLLFGLVTFCAVLPLTIVYAQTAPPENCTIRALTRHFPG